MNISVKTLGKVLCGAVILFTGSSAFAQDGAYTGFTPYSIFGLGDINNAGSAYNNGMGGVGTATRNRRYLNYINPAAVTARDSLSVLADMSLFEGNRVMSQGDLKSANNTFNINNIAISFPIYKHSAMMFGIAPYSSVGYKYQYLLNDDSIVGNTGHAAFISSGKGSIYKTFASAGVTLFRRLSLGVEGDLFFGTIDKESEFTFAKTGFSGIDNGFLISLRGTSAKFGLQYEQPLGSKTSVVVGATYSLGSKLKGYVDEYKIASGASQNDTLYFASDTLGVNADRISIPSEIGLGLSINHADTWRAEVNYSRSDWTNSGLDKSNGFSISGASSFSTRVSQTFRAGFEIVPNRNDIRYFYKRCAYRVGAYYDKSYFAVDGNQVNDMGITLGASIPVFRYFNSVTFAVSLGQRASTAQNMIRERYMNFTFGFNFADQWFFKPTYK